MAKDAVGLGCNLYRSGFHSCFVAQLGLLVVEDVISPARTMLDVLATRRACEQGRRKLETVKISYQASDVEIRDEVYKLISHLHAQTMLICGEGLENFINHNDEIKSNYLWSICDLAERSLVLVSRLHTSTSDVIKSD